MDERPAGKILLVVPEGADDFATDILGKLDHPVQTCHGPGSEAVCPLVHGDGCAWYEEAHGIVFSLDLSRSSHREILSSYRELAESEGRDLPMRVVIPAGEPVPPDLDVTVWNHEPSVAELDGFAAWVEATDR